MKTTLSLSILLIYVLSSALSMTTDNSSSPSDMNSENNMTDLGSMGGMSGMTMTGTTSNQSNQTTTNNDMGSMAGMSGMDMNGTQANPANSSNMSGMDMNGTSEMDMGSSSTPNTTTHMDSSNSTSSPMDGMPVMNTSSTMPNMPNMSGMGNSSSPNTTTHMDSSNNSSDSMGAMPPGMDMGVGGSDSNNMGANNGMSDMSNCSCMPDMSDMGGMSMYFMANSEATFLIGSWKSETPGGVILGCFLTYIFCFAASFLNFYKRIYLRRVNGHKHDSFNDKEHGHHHGGNSLKVRIHLSLIFMLQTTFAGLIMLLYMTYNVWVFIAIVLGLGTGYFLVDSKYDTKASAAGGHHC